MNSFLDEITWRKCVTSLPICAIDLIFVQNNSRVLMGKRTNEPAKNTYFVPGGRIFKNESIKEAFERISLSETKQTFDFINSKFLGCFEHFYDNSKWLNYDISTHYIVLAYQININNVVKFDLSSQHNSYLWLDKKSIARSEIHKYSINYLNLVL